MISYKEREREREILNKIKTEKKNIQIHSNIRRSNTHTLNSVTFATSNNDNEDDDDIRAERIYSQLVK